MFNSKDYGCKWEFENTYLLYVCVLFGSVKPEWGVIPSGQETYSKVNI